MFESDLEDNVFRRRLMKEVAPGVPVHFSFYSPSVKVQVMHPAENLPGANGRYIGDAVTIEFVPDDAAAVERVRRHVRAGDVYQANVCRVLAAPLAGTAGEDPSPGALAALLAHGNPAPTSPRRRRSRTRHRRATSRGASRRGSPRAASRPS